MKKIITFVLVVFILAGCQAPAKIPQQYQTTYLDLFDTVTTVAGYAETREEFEKTASVIYERLKRYHQLFDIYHNYEENNMKTINDQAGIGPVKVDKEIMELLLDCKEYYELTNGKVNVAMGSVLRVWQEARKQGEENPEKAVLPSEEELQKAAQYCRIEDIIIDQQASTVYLKEPQMSLDVGAVAKGWATQKVCQDLPGGILVSVGGNVKVTGPKPEKDSPWVVGIQAPWGDYSEYAQKLHLKKGSAVTSGDYQRYYTVEGKRYHHLIDPDTLYPGDKWKSVSVICEDSGLADALSTALFLLPRQEGEKLLEKGNARAIWIASRDEIYYSHEQIP